MLIHRNTLVNFTSNDASNAILTLPPCSSKTITQVNLLSHWNRPTDEEIIEFQSFSMHFAMSKNKYVWTASFTLCKRGTSTNVEYKPSCTRFQPIAFSSMGCPKLIRNHKNVNHIQNLSRNDVLDSMVLSKFWSEIVTIKCEFHFLISYLLNFLQGAQNALGILGNQTKGHFMSNLTFQS